ncbi:MAG: hypothetical protein IKL31_10945 [Ruminococcus sp.]|nr:hypothetical protein [Ruminococcus sp.]MBO5383469.1 hypothetical protein [Ruminococcus sp.]MBR6671236.1 hypothetical protein [Ruminococcus sp.]
MSDASFVSADTNKIAEFEEKSPEVISEFDAIKQEFKRINSELLSTWEGAGANAYKYETDNILEKVGSVEDVLKAINESVVKDIRSTYSSFDEEMGTFNMNPYSEEGE